VLPLALAACGGSSSKTVSGDPLVTAADATSKQSSEKVTTKAKIDLSGQALSLASSGAFRGDDGELHGRFSFGSFGSSTLDEVFKGNVVWLRSPLLASTLRGKHWIKLDLDKGAQAFGFNLAALAGQTPSSVLDTLRLPGKVSEAGTETVAGVETTHYHEELNATQKGALYKSLDAWIDDKNLVRQVKLDYGARVDPTSTERAHTVLTMTFSDFGTPVSVSTPPAADVVDSSQLGK
jgi:hypothetical protein